MRKHFLLSAAVLILSLVTHAPYAEAQARYAEASESENADQGDTSAALVEVPQTIEEIEAWWKAGRTLPLETTNKYPLAELNVKDDTGINVLIDMAHKCNFFTMWKLGHHLNHRGLRTVGSLATLDSVLTPGSSCRVRIPVAPRVLPFAWWKAARFNVVLTEGEVHNPGYDDRELEALDKFVRDGGGLVVSGSLVRDENNGIGLAHTGE